MTLITGLTLTGLTGVAAAAEPAPGATGGAHLLGHPTGSGSAAPQLGVGIWGS